MVWYGGSTYQPRYGFILLGGVPGDGADVTGSSRSRFTIGALKIMRHAYWRGWADDECKKEVYKVISLVLT